LQGRSDLDPHEIVRVIQPAGPGVISRLEPVGSDHGQKHLALGDRLMQGGDEVHPQRDSVHIHEQQVAPELLI
jgi:hypothetical protein